MLRFLPRSLFVVFFGLCVCSSILNAQADRSTEQPTARKVFVVDKVTYTLVSARQEAEHHSAPVVMSEFMKNCPNLSFTENQENAAVLKSQPGSLTLSNVKGDILYISPAKTLANMVKNVCTFIAAH